MKKYKIVYEEWYRYGDGALDWDYKPKEKLCDNMVEAEFVVSKLKLDYRNDEIRIVELEELPTAEL